MSCPNTRFDKAILGDIFKKAKKVFFIGIGGISMSSLAEYCVFCGKEVYGYDRVRSKICEKLEVVCKIRYCSSPDSVVGMDLVVYTGAIGEDNFEYVKARSIGIPTVSRADLLGCIMTDYKTRIGIAGMHGKSTTCAMLSHIFGYAAKSPTVFCGAEMQETGSAYKFGSRDFFIFEACEYEDSFLSMSPTDAVITNIDFDHPDYFKSMEQIISSFQKYVKKADRVFINGDNPSSLLLKHKKIITFGMGEKNEYRAKIIHSPGKNTQNIIKPHSEFEVYRKEKLLARCSLSQFGLHNIYNALCAFAVSCENGIEVPVIAEALSCFEGSRRRMEFLRITNTGAYLFEDYAHHPTEIRASLDSLCEMGFKKILCVFQSHTYSRTYALYNDFCHSFEKCAHLIVYPIYAAREKNVYPITDEGFACDCGGIFMSDYTSICSYIKKSDADCVVIMGAGDIDALCDFIK